MAMKGQWTGMEHALQNVYTLGRELADDKVIIPALKKVAKPLREDIVRTAPRSTDTKHMADTFVIVEHEGQVLVGPKGGRGSVGFVAPFVEFGTSQHRAQPFIRPSYDGWAVGYPRALVVELQAAYNRIARKLKR